MKACMYQVDSFSPTVFGGNPAAVLILNDWFPPSLMQKIANENNLSETAFIVAEESFFRIRWFTPTSEIDLCGHATLAGAWVLHHENEAIDFPIHFRTKNDVDLFVDKDENFLVLDFPAAEVKRVELCKEAKNFVPVDKLVGAYYDGDDYLLVLKDEETLKSFVPDQEAITKLPGRGLILTAPRNDVEHSFHSRFFCPKLGIPEDPVTGSAHCVLAPYWSSHWNTDPSIWLEAVQGSKRLGYLRVRTENGRAFIAGEVALYMKAEISLPS